MQTENNKLNENESINIMNPQGEYNGKGKEYYENGDIKFEGDYINGKRNRNGTEYYSKKNDCNNFGRNMMTMSFLSSLDRYGILTDEGKHLYKIKKDKVKYIGQFLNGVKNGKGTSYKINGQIEYEGEFLNNKIIRGKKYKNNKVIYEGDFCNQQYHGKGKEYINGHLIYEGEFEKGKRHGNGKEFKYGNVVFEGKYENGKRVE